MGGSSKWGLSSREKHCLGQCLGEQSAESDRNYNPAYGVFLLCKGTVRAVCEDMGNLKKGILLSWEGGIYTSRTGKKALFHMV